ncbi:MAG: hypothetical protein JXA97_00680 [Anaerolineales bacterium]|nr:hypothetical protein [Anaerolineales bacterium]
MQIRCFRCNWSFSVKKEELAFALETLEESGDAHYDVPCPKCRRMNKISIEQLRRAVPKTEEQ